MVQKFDFQPLDLQGAYRIKPFYATDNRGGLIKDYNVDTFRANGIDHDLKEVFYTISKRGVMTVGGVTVPVSMDWLPEEQGETFLLEAPWERARSQNATVNPDGTVTIRLELETDVYGIGQPQTSTLTLQVPAGQGFAKNEKEEAK